MTTMTTDSAQAAVPLPRGELSEALARLLASGQASAGRLPSPDGVDPAGHDAQLALQICYELHYRGFAGVDDAWEWDPTVLRLRAELERAFLDWLRASVDTGGDPMALLEGMTIDHQEGQGISYYLRDHADWSQFRELFAHRSIYHLKEADPHAWVIPRLTGRAKAALVAVEFDEYGGGRADQMHQQLFADLLTAAELDSSYLGYVNDVPAQTLATVNFISMCGLHRKLRGALVGLFAAAEITTAPSARRTVQGLRRLAAPAACVHFYTEHMEADAVHELVLRQEVVGTLLAEAPALATDIVFGVRAADMLYDRLTAWMLERWAAGRSSLLSPL